MSARGGGLLEALVPGRPEFGDQRREEWAGNHRVEVEHGKALGCVAGFALTTARKNNEKSGSRGGSRAMVHCYSLGIMLRFRVFCGSAILRAWALSETDLILKLS